MKRILITAAAVITCAATFAQTDFSGTWKLKTKEHISGPAYGNAIPEEFKVTQTKDSIVIESGTSRVSYAMNGGETSSVGATSKRKSVRSVTWSEGKKVVTLKAVISVAENPNEVDLTRIETWGLSADGKTLSLDRSSVETRSENWQTKGIYEKQ
jgi:N-methylhydantoinase B/oxoprolinase/acetone carboxylase alpha subunit